MDVIVNPPKPGEPSYESHKAQKETVLTGLAARAKLVAETFNSMEGKRSKCKYFLATAQRFPVPNFSIPIPVLRLSKFRTRFRFRFQDRTSLDLDYNSKTDKS